MRVYYFTTEKYAQCNLEHQRLKISRFSDLNDPFELLGLDVSDKPSRFQFRAEKEKIDKKQGLICFSRSWKNPLMWGHYAEKCTGICLGFEVADDMLKAVSYQGHLLKRDVDVKTYGPKHTNEVIQRLMATKYVDWQYEQEQRLFVMLEQHKKDGNNYFYSFSKDVVLREIILGPNCKLSIERVREMVSKNHPRVRVIKSRIAFKNFKLTTDIAASRLNQIKTLDT